LARIAYPSNFGEKVCRAIRPVNLTGRPKSNTKDGVAWKFRGASSRSIAMGESNFPKTTERPRAGSAAHETWRLSISVEKELSPPSAAWRARDRILSGPAASTKGLASSL
jgi:hypothetical protein